MISFCLQKVFISIKLSAYEAQGLVVVTIIGTGIWFAKCNLKFFSECDAVGFKIYKEIKGAYCEYIGHQFENLVLCAGSIVPEPPKLTLELWWEKLLSNSEAEILIFCASGRDYLPKKINS